MKFVFPFFFTLLLTLFIALQVPAIQDGSKELFLNFLESEFGIEVHGEMALHYFPPELTLKEVVLHDETKALFRATSVTIGVGSFSILDLQPPRAPLHIEGSFWIDRRLSPYGDFFFHHPEFGESAFSFSFKPGGKRSELLLSVVNRGPLGSIDAEGTLIIPQAGLKKTLQEGNSLMSTWKVSWEEARFGTAVGYVTFGYEDEKLTIPSLEIAGTLWDEPFIIEGTGELEHPLIDFRLYPLEATLGSLTFSEGDIGISLYRSESSWEGSIEALALLKGELVKGVGHLSLKEGESLKLDEGILTFKGGSGSIEGEFDFLTRLFDLSLTLATDNLVPLTEMKGDLLAHGHLLTYLDTNFFPYDPRLTVHLFSNELEKGAIRIKDEEAFLYLAEIEGLPTWKISSQTEQLSVEGEVFKNLTFLSEGKTGDLSPFSFSLQKEGETVLAKGEVSPSLEGIRLFFQSLEGTLYQLPLALDETAFIAFFADGWLLDRFHLKVANSHLKLSGRGGSGEIALQGEISNLFLEEFSSQVKGKGYGSVEIFGPLDDLEGFLTLNLSEFEMDSFATPLFPLRGQLTSRFSPHVALLKGNFKGVQGELLEGEGKIAFKKDFPIEGDFNFKGELAPLLTLILPDTTSASGTGNGTFEVDGTLLNPRFLGKLELRNGAYEDLVTGMVYRQLKADFILEGDHILLEGLSAFDRAGGEIIGEGDMRFSEKLPYQIVLETKRGELINLDYALARATGKVLLSGNLDGGKLEGELKVDEMSINLPDKTPILLQKLDVIYEKIHPIEEAEPKSFAWDLKIDLAEQPAKVVGSAFSTEWRGEFLLQGTTYAPLLFGKGKLVDAKFTFNGKTFESKDGMILFQGEPSSKTSFYITAKQEIEDLKIDILLKGPLKSPELSFRSNPPKSSKEILSYLLFNRGTGNTSSYEGQELSETPIKLDSTTASDPNLLDRLKSSLGIDRLEISGDSLNDPESVSVEVGKYLSSSLYFCLKKSVSDGPNQAAIVAKLPHHLKAQGEIGDDAEGKFMLKWERDY